MSKSSGLDVGHILAALPHLYRGPGGSAAVLKDGELIAHRAWGYANLEQRAPMRPDTLLPICSISKQMVCLTTISLCRNPTPAMLMKDQDPLDQMNAELKKLLPNLADLPNVKLRLEHLCHMQSGIRDYWAMTTLFGARPDDPFSIAIDAPKALERTKSFHFAPGTEYSYSNVNFHVLGRVLENVSGQSLNQLLSERVFIPAGMTTATLYINTNGIPLPMAGYEGNEKVGYFSATNRIEWAGDAGIAASLNDMIAYEKYLHRSWQDPSSLYYHIAQPPTYDDGTPARYGFGLARNAVAEKAAIRHGGALRGFRLSRMHIPSEQVSVVVMLNHEADAGSASDFIFKRMLDYVDPKPNMDLMPAPEWAGNFLDEGSKLCINVKAGPEQRGRICMHYNRGEEVAALTSATHAETSNFSATIAGDVLNVRRIDDNRTLLANRVIQPTDIEVFNANSSSYTGVYRCEEADCTFHCSGENGTLYGSFDGFLGKGPVWLMTYRGEDVWMLGNPRAMDSTPPGDWTVLFHREQTGTVNKVTIGCWLARGVEFERQI